MKIRQFIIKNTAIILFMLAVIFMLARINDSINQLDRQMGDINFRLGQQTEILKQVNQI